MGSAPNPLVAAGCAGVVAILSFVLMIASNSGDGLAFGSLEFGSASDESVAYTLHGMMLKAIMLPTLATTSVISVSSVPRILTTGLEAALNQEESMSYLDLEKLWSGAGQAASASAFASCSGASTFVNFCLVLNLLLGITVAALVFVAPQTNRLLVEIVVGLFIFLNFIAIIVWPTSCLNALEADLVMTPFLLKAQSKSLGAGWALLLVNWFFLLALAIGVFLGFQDPHASHKDAAAERTAGGPAPQVITSSALRGGDVTQGVEMTDSDRV